MGFCGWVVAPFNLSPEYAAAVGALTGVGIILCEIRVGTLSVKTLVGSALGSIGGILGASLISLVIGRMRLEPQTATFSQITILVLMTYVGLVVGAAKGQFLDLSAFEGLFTD